MGGEGAERKARVVKDVKVAAPVVFQNDLFAVATAAGEVA